MKLSNTLSVNVNALEALFADCGDFVSRRFPIGGNTGKTAYIAYLDGLADRDYIDQNIVSKLMSQMYAFNGARAGSNLYEAVLGCFMTTVDYNEVATVEELAGGILAADMVLLIDGFATGIVVSAKGFSNRGVPTAEAEVVVQGAKDSFSEVLRTNTMLIRRRLSDHRLKSKNLSVGKRGKCPVALMYLSDVVRPEVLREVTERVENIDIDAIIDGGYIDQFIEDDYLSPFPQTQITERPDKAASAILEGRVAIVSDNTPFVILVPATVNVFFQTSEDYSQRFEIMSLTRILRYACAVIAIAAPGLYLAIALYHPSMIPSVLAFKMASARLYVPFPAIIEMLLMTASFELIREAGVRLPGAVGSAIGIVGGIIVGQAAVDAGIVSPIVVIIIALTGMAGFAVPNYSLVSAFRIMNVFVTVMSAVAGLFGFWSSMLIILIHLASLKSFGIPYLFPFVSGGVNDFTDLKDSILRLPLFMLKKRPIFANPRAKTRMGSSTGNVKTKE